MKTIGGWEFSTVRSRQKEFNDGPLRSYGGTKRDVNNFYGDECEVAIVSGMPEGIGKSAYVNHVLADLYSYQGCRDGELLKVRSCTRRERYR